MSLKEKIIVPLLVAAITGTIIYGTFNFFGTASDTSVNAGNTSDASLRLTDSAQLKDGIYEGTAMGYAGPVTTRITIKNGKIVKAEVVSHNETPEYFAYAEKILLSIVNANTYDVDAVSGATVTCNAIKDGVHKAMLKALGKAKEAENLKDKNLITPPVKDGPVINTSAVPSGDIMLPSKLKDGTYYGQGTGYRGEIRVAVTIRNGIITSIEVLEHNEDISYFNKAVSIIDRLINGASSVDTVTGATISSRGIIQAVNHALSQAGIKDTLITPGKPSPAPGQNENIVKPVLPPDMPSIPEGVKLKDGTYYASANGYAVLVGKDVNQNSFPEKDRIPVKVKVVIKDGALYEIEVVEHRETPEYFEAAKKVIDDFLNGKENVDTVTGATFTSAAIKTAVITAIKEAGHVDEKPLTYADGIWYGQAYGFHSSEKWHGVENDENLNTQTNVQVEIRKGKIKDIKLIQFGDDMYYHDNFLLRNDAFNKINREVIRTNGTESAVEKFVINKTSGTGQETDAISGATFSGNGYINAISDALQRSLKASGDNKIQHIKYFSILPHKDQGHSMKLPYGKPFNVGNFRILLGYAEDNNSIAKTKIITLEEAVKLGINIDLSEFPGIDENLIFTPMPDNPEDFSVNNSYNLVLKDPVSGSKSMYKGIQGSRESENLLLKEVIITDKNGTDYVIPWDNTDSRQTVKMSFRPSDVTAVKVIDERGNIAKLKSDKNSSDPIAQNGFGVRSNQPDILRVEIAVPENPKNSITALNYKYKSLQITFDISFDPANISSIKVTEMPVTEYTVGDTLDLSNLKVQFTDSFGISGKTIPFNDFDKMGITVKGINHGHKLTEAGEITITLESLQNGKTITTSFNIKVKDALSEKDRIESGVRFYDLRSGTPVIVAEAELTDGSNRTTMAIPEELYNLKAGLQNPADFKWTITDQFGKDFDMMPEGPFVYISGQMMLYNANGSSTKFVKLSIAEPEERVEKSVRFYKITDEGKTLIAEAELPEGENRTKMILDEKYIKEGKELANSKKYYWTIADQNGNDFDMMPEGPFAYTSGTMMLYNANGSSTKMVKLEART